MHFCLGVGSDTDSNEQETDSELSDTDEDEEMCDQKEQQRSSKQRITSRDKVGGKRPQIVLHCPKVLPVYGLTVTQLEDGKTSNQVQSSNAFQFRAL